METPHRFQIGDRVRTIQRVHRLPAGSTGTIQKIINAYGLLDVLFDGHRVPTLMYSEQLVRLESDTEAEE